MTPCLSCPLGSGEPFRSSCCVLLSCCCVVCLFLAGRGLVCDCDFFPFLSCPLGSGEPFRSSCCVFCGSKCYMPLPRGVLAWSVIVTLSRASRAPWDQVSPSGPLVVFCYRVAVPYVSSSRCRGLVCDCDFFLCLSRPLGSGEPFRSSSCVLCGSKCYMPLPRGVVAWSVIVTLSRASHAPLDQVSPSGPLVVFCCRVAVSYVSSSRCRGLVCDCDFFPCLSCPLGSGEPFRSSSCVLCGSKCYMSLPRVVVAWSVIVTLSRASHAPWDQVSPSGPLVVLCRRVAVSYVSSSRCRGLVCDCDFFPCLSCPLGSGEPFRSSSCVLCCSKCYMSLPRVVVAWSVIVTFSRASSCPLGSGEPFRSSSYVLLSCGCVICLFLTVPWLGL